MVLCVCIAIPSKNRHASLRQTLPNALACGVPIVICDQSPKPFQPEVEQAAMIRVLHHPEIQSLPAARNRLLAACADVELMIFIDDDCDVSPDFARQCQGLAEAEPFYYAWGPIIERRTRWQRRLSRLAQLGCFRDPRRLATGPCDYPSKALFGCAFVVRRSAALAVGGFDASRKGYSLGEDLDFFLRLNADGCRSRFARQLKARHREDHKNRASPVTRGAAKARFWVFLARHHGRGNPATLIHLSLALLSAASGLGREPGAAWGVLRGLGCLDRDHIRHQT